jgi:hypothetical protein
MRGLQALSLGASREPFLDLAKERRRQEAVVKSIGLGA